MPAFSVDVPHGTFGPVGLVPVFWKAPVNTVIAAFPNLLAPGDECTILLSGVPEGAIPFIGGLAQTVLSSTPNTITFVADAVSGLGRRQLTLSSPLEAKSPWMNSITAAVKPEYASEVTVAWLYDVEIVTGSPVTLNGATVYSGDHVQFPGTTNSNMRMGTPIHGLPANDATPEYLVLFEFRAPNNLITLNFGDSDFESATYNGWLLRVYATSFDILHGDGGTPGAGARKSVAWAHSAITDWTYNSNEWIKVAMQVDSLSTGRICINGGQVFTSTGTSGTGSTMDVSSTTHGCLGGYQSDVGPYYGTFDLRHFAILIGTHSAAQIQELCVNQYGFYQPAA